MVDQKLFISCVVFLLLACVVDLKLAIVLGLILYLLMQYATATTTILAAAFTPSVHEDEGFGSDQEYLDDEDDQVPCKCGKRKANESTQL